MAINPILEAALRYAAKGWRVFPCHGKKQPAIKEWQRKATTDYTQIKNWWLEWPTALVAIATGEESGIFVVDVDGPTGDLSLLDLTSNTSKLPPTYSVKTPHGKHLYFTVPVGVLTKSSTSDLGEKLDVRGDGGYVIAPPSINEEGTPYTVSAEGLPANPPEWLLDLVRKDGKTKSATKNPIVSGGRNDYLAKTAGKLRNYGLSEKLIYENLKEINFQQCRPPLPDKEVQAIASSIARYDPKLIGDDGSVRGEVIAGNLADVQEVPAPFRWPGVLPFADLCTFAGEAGNGKSQMSCFIAARMTKGEPFPGDETGDIYEPVNVLFISAEDAPGKTIKPRCMVAGADVSKIFYMKIMKSDNKPLDMSSDLFQIKTFAQENKIGLIVIDPLDAYLGMDIDSHASADMRRVLAPLQELAAEVNCIVIIIGHLNKSNTNSPMQRISGSGAVVNAARSVAIFAPSKEAEGERVMACIKSNLGVKFRSYRYMFEEVHLAGIGKISRIKFTGASDETADSLFRIEAADGKLEDAQEWLREILAAGAVSSTILDKRARAEHISRATLLRAKKNVAIQQWGKGGSYWMLKGTKWQPELIPESEV